MKTGLNAKEAYSLISHPGVNITAHVYIKELEQQKKEMLEVLIDLYKNITSIRPLMRKSIENATGKPIEDILK